jgi:hypothetical protein
LAEQAKKLKDELVEAGAWPLEEDDLNAVAGGCYHPFLDFKDPTQPKR